MAQIKIISNPYKKEIRYQKWSDVAQEWVDIDYSNCKNSKLLSQGFAHGFFPFQAKQIVDSIVEEYGAAGETLQVLFEGSADEFKEFEAACKDESYLVELLAVRSDTYLENARDILPEVRKLFQELSPLIHQSVSADKIQRDLSRFTDASSDVVPVCVLGNYSAGKSTFINALIGSEILPSGIEPITAKIYKISRSKYIDRASVKCKYLYQDICLLFTEHDYFFDGDQTPNPLIDELKKGLNEVADSSIVVRVNKVLSILNDFESDKADTMISDLIEVEIPFIKGVLAKSQHPFVLFDTPGSNSASNARHLEVLKEAMANMTNGLPIFLSTPDSLDSTDNENLYHIIRDMDELDSRFTMIVVNKSDGPGLQRKDSTNSEQSRILNQAVPRNLYSGGLFYVSSILGLGAKNDGDFLDDFYAETYDDQVYKYSNPNERRYKTLYSFNIMPAQIKHRADALAASQTDLVYANSGLFSVETEIENFAGMYSAYNKCFQSQMFLRRVIQITQEEIEEKKVSCDEIRHSITVKLEDDKKRLIDKLETAATERRDEYDGEYPVHMGEVLEGKTTPFSVEALTDEVEKYTAEFESEMELDARKGEAQNAQEQIADNLVSVFRDAEHKFSMDTFRSAWQGLQEDRAAAKEAKQAQKATRHRVDKAAADKLLAAVTDSYEKQLAWVYELLDKQSQAFWAEKTEAFRNILIHIVTGSDVLTDEKRRELEQIIITYDRIVFKENKAEVIFNRENFERRFRLFDMTLWQSDHLDIKKLTQTYNSNVEEGVERRYRVVADSHRTSAHTWIRSLLDVINENIVEYSPELSKQAKQIRLMTEQIAELEQRQVKLRNYTEQLCSMMDWKNA